VSFNPIPDAAPEELEDIFRTLVDNAFTAIYIIQDWRFAYVNPRTADLLGYSRAELLSGEIPLEQLVAGEDWELVQTRMRQRLAGGAPEARYRFRVRRRDGRLLPVQIFSSSICFRGRPALLATLMDLTDLLQMEAHLAEQLHFMEQLLDAIPSPIFYKGMDGRYLGCNQAFAETLGQDKAGIVGRSVYDLAPADLAARYAAADRELLQAGGTQSYETQVQYADGRRRDMHFYKAVFRHQDGEPGGLVGAMLDITRLKRKEAALELAERVFDASSEGILITDADGRILRTNRAFCDMTGYSEAEALGQTPAFIKSGRHDMAFYSALWQQVFLEGRWQGEIWNRRKDGEVYPAWLSISAARNETGQITNFIGISTDISRHKEAEAHINRLAYFDTLTGLPNRALLQDRLDQAIALARASRQGERHVVVMFLNLDRLKHVNDSLGHASGDRVIQIMAERLTGLLGPQVTVSRHVGDQFALIFTELPGSRAAAAMAEQLLQTVQAPVELGEQQFSLTASIGISLFPGDGEDGAALLRNADAALHHAKLASRGSFQFYRDEMNAASLERLVFEQSLRHALERGELELFYQPQFELEGGQLIGMEALLRWRHPDLGLVPPDRFIPLAEETGLIVPIGRWVLQEACRQAAAWSRLFAAPLRMAVNLSATQFVAEDLVGVVRQALEQSGLPPAQLELELTESTLMGNADQATATLRELKGLGVLLAVDDFGTGYSSLAYLRRFPLDTLKIDRSFVLDMERDANAGAITQAVVALGRSLGLITVAEGVETQAQEAILKALHCTVGQGYLFSRPIPAAELESAIGAGRWPLPALPQLPPLP